MPPSILHMMSAEPVVLRFPDVGIVRITNAVYQEDFELSVVQGIDWIFCIIARIGNNPCSLSVSTDACVAFLAGKHEY